MTDLFPSDRRRSNPVFGSAAVAAGDGPLPSGPEMRGEAASPQAASPLALSGAPRGDASPGGLALSEAYLARTLNGEREIHAVLRSGAMHALSIEDARRWLAELQPLVDLADGKHPFSKKRG